MTPDYNLLISIVAPCYNEEDVLVHFMDEIDKVVTAVQDPFELIFINDGSSDNTLTKLREIKERYAYVRVINLSRNFGKEAAMTAGIDASKGAALIPIDVDLQDPPELIKEFVTKWQEGYEVVLAKRIDRTSDTKAKRLSAELFYKFHNNISHVKIPNNVGDYRLMSRKVINAIQKLPENQRFMKGIFAWVGFNTTTVEYVRDPRKAGETSFNGWKLWNFAVEGITSFSTVPLRIWLYVGFVIAFIALVFGAWIVLKTLIFGIDAPGYASMTTIVLFLGGIQLMGIGILGEYIGRLFIEAKRRPVYIIDEEL